jgi:hypothetical protein
VRAVLPLNAALVDESEVGFVDEGRRLERVVDTLGSKVAIRHPLELSVDGVDELVERLLVPIAPAFEK